VRPRTGFLVAAVIALGVLPAVLVGGCGGTTSTTSSSGTDTAVGQESTTTTALGLVYTGTLEGANEVPAVKTSATGTITLTITPDGLSADYVITLKKLSNVTIAKLHQGEPGADGGAIATLFNGPVKSGVFSGELVQGSLAASDLGGPLKGKTLSDLLDLLDSGQVFLNVGTSSHKSGAICGQLEASSATVASTTTTAIGATTSSETQSTVAQGGQSVSALFGKFQQAGSVSLDFVVTAPDGTKTSGKMWSDAGKHMKIQTTVNGAENVMIMDLVAQTMVVYQPATKQGMKTTLNIPVQDPSSYADAANASDLQDLGTETVNGETCRVVQYTTTDPTGGTTTVKMWLSERLGYPVKVTSTTADGKTTTMEYSNIQVGSLPSDTFTVPADVNIMSAP
jgi:outer membrane lipoprotein-sorting protein